MTASAGSGRAWLVPVLRGFSGLTAGRATASVLSAVFLAAVARHLSTGDFGELVLLLAFGTVAGVICDRGLQIVVGLHAAEAGAIDLRLLDKAIERRVLLAVPTALVVVVLYLVAVRDGSAAEPLIFAVSILGTCVYQLSLASYMALGKVSLNAYNEIVSRVLVLGVGLVWLLHGGGLFGVVACYSLADLCSAIVVYMIVRNRYGQRETRVRAAERLDPSDHAARPGRDGPRRLFEDRHLPRHPHQGHVGGGLLRLGLPGAHGGHAAGPRAQPDRHRPHRAARHGPPSGDALRLAALAAAPTVPALVLSLLFADTVMTFVFGSAYSVAGPTLVVLLASAIPGAAVLVLAPLAAVGNRVRYAWVTVAGLVANVAVNLVLIPIAGSLGAAWANLISQVMIAGVLISPWMLLPDAPPAPAHVPPGPPGAAGLGATGELDVGGAEPR